jgi:predicted phage terminase large subunit-like protein
VLHPEREPLAALERIKTNLGAHAFSAQYQQSPVPLGGGMIKWTWFRRYREPPARAPQDRIVQSWDTASKATEISDYSVCTTWLVRSKLAYLIDVLRERLEYPDLRRRVIALAERHKPDAILIEDKASGTSLVQDLRDQNLAIVRIEPEGDKVTRASTVSARIEGGLVFVPDDASWLGEFEIEVSQFPQGRFDDQVDSMSQLLNWLREREIYDVALVEPGSVPCENVWGMGGSSLGSPSPWGWPF